MDPEQAREELRTVLKSFGAEVTLFDDPHLDILLRARYCSARTLQSASREGLTATGLPLGLVDHILALKGSAVAGSPGPGSSSGPQLFNNVTVFLPNRSAGGLGYIERNFRKLTTNQLQKKLECKDYHHVLPVDKQPPLLLQLADCAKEAQDVEDVELRDGMQLAVVVDEKSSTLLEQQVATLNGWKNGQIAGSEYECAEWATAQVADDTGGHRCCFKEINGLIGDCPRKIEVDGMAYSDVRVVLVERKPRISLEHLEGLAAQVRTFKGLVVGGAPNTAVLLDSSTGQVKRLEVYLMADRWVDDSDETAACSLRMEEEGIRPVLPNAAGYAIGDSCDRWPVQADARQRGRKFLAKLGCQPQSSGAGTDVGSGMAGLRGGAVGSNSAVGCRHASSSPAACSPPAPARHLLRGPPLSSSAAAWVQQRRVASTCRPAHLLSRQLSSSCGLSMRRL